MMLVVIIIGVLTGIGSRTYFVEKERFEFNNAFSETIQSMKNARNRATTSDSHYIGTPIASPIGSVIPRDGFGVHFEIIESPTDPEFNNLRITSFVNLGPGPTKTQYQDDDDPSTYDPLDDVQVDQFTLPDHVALRSYDFDSSTDQPDQGLQEQWTDIPVANRGPTELEAVVMFRPPLGQAYIGDNQGNELSALRFNFYNPAAPDNSNKKCIFIDINKVRSFPQLSYGTIDQCLP